MKLDNAAVYDIECLPNIFTLSMEMLNSDVAATWEISEYRDDRQTLIQWITWMRSIGAPMIGFNSLNYDYPMLHHFLNHPQSTYVDLHNKSQSIIDSDDRFGHMIWDRDRHVTQIDLYKLHHFDNKAKTTSLKALQINMRSENVRESRLPFDRPVALADVDSELIPYNKHDVKETKRFAFYSMGAIEFRIGLIQQFGLEVLNYNDTKIGEKMLEQRLGDDVCYRRVEYLDRGGNVRTRKEKRQTPRQRIAVKDIIFPYVQFENPEFQRIHAYMLEQVLTPEDLDDPEATIKTKGVFNVQAEVGGLTFHFGTGGVHASVSSKRFSAGNGWLIRDIDVEGLYPNIAIVNNIAPAHLGEAFTTEYGKIPTERKTHAKGTYQNAALKLAANGAWGKSNSKYSVFYDPAYAMTVPINGQLLICMLVEQLVKVPTLSLIQANTDGITYMIHENYLTVAQSVEVGWERLTKLTLESCLYSRMWIRDCNNYIAEYAE